MTVALAIAAATAVLLSPVQTSAPAPPVPVAAPERAPSTEGLALAAILFSEEMMTGPRADRQGREMMAELVRTHPQLSAIERETPGLAKRISDVVIPIALRSAAVRLPELHRRVASLYDSRFDPTEIARIRDFYTSPTGMRFIERMAGQTELSETVRSAAASDDFLPDASAMVGDLARTGADIATSMSPEDQAVLIALSQTGLSSRIAAVSTQSAQLMLDWSTELTPGEQIETERAVEAAVKAHIGGRQ